MTLTVGSKLGPYEILSPLGAGGMGEVYRAKDSRLGREVAIKVLPAGFAVDGERLKRFELEAKATSALNHPNILSIFDIGTHEGAPYLVAELLEGETLREKLNGGPLPPRKTVEWAVQMARGLAVAHEKNIVHRDLKPENLFITKDGRLKILDFGLAKLTEAAKPPEEENNTPTRTVNTAAGSVMGTVGYMSPEQVRGEPVDARSDLFAFGVILYEMISGTRAFKKNSAVETMNAILTEEPQEFASLQPPPPPGLERIIGHCLEKMPAARYQSARDLGFQLEALSGISGIGITAIAAAATQARHLFRAALIPPEKSKFELDDAHAASLALSPDGRKLVFVAETPDKQKPLWIRAFDSLTAQPLAGTEEALYPFWSPDSRFIAFIAKGKLKKIDISGGSISTLCDAPSGYGGTWSVNNLILFIPKLFGPIHQVSALGGVSSPVAEPPGSRLQDAHHYPVFLPDGQHYLYLRRGATEQIAFAIYVASLDGKTNRFVTQSDSNVAFACGHLLYQRGNALLAQPFDPEAKAVTGEPITLAEPVRIINRRLLGTFSASQHGALVYQSAKSEWHGDDFQLLWLDRTGKETGLLGKPQLHETIRLSPDGKRVATVIRVADKKANDLWIIDVKRGLKTRLTLDSSYKDSPVWSPDSKRLVYSAARADGFELYVIDADGSGSATRILQSPNRLFPADWSPDGRLLVYGERMDRSKNQWRLLGLPLEGGQEPVPVLKDAFTLLQSGFPFPAARFSPDGKWLAYQADLSGAGDVFVTPFPGPGSRTLIASDGSEFPFWRGDGKALLYLQNDGLMETDLSFDGDTLEVGETRILFSKWVKEMRGLHISSDGERFLTLIPQEELTREQQSEAPPPVNLVINWDAELKK